MLMHFDPKRSQWITKILPALKTKLKVLVEGCGKRLCRRENYALVDASHIARPKNYSN